MPALDESGADDDAGSGYESVNLSDMEGYDFDPDTAGRGDDVEERGEENKPSGSLNPPDSPTTQSASLAPRGEVLTQLATLEDATPRRPPKKANNRSTLAERMAALRATRGAKKDKAVRVPAQKAIAPASKTSPSVIVNGNDHSPPKAKQKSQATKLRKKTTQKSRQKPVARQARRSLFDPSDDELENIVIVPKPTAPSLPKKAGPVPESGNESTAHFAPKRSNLSRSDSGAPTDDAVAQRKTVSSPVEKVVVRAKASVRSPGSGAAGPPSSAVVVTSVEKSPLKTLGGRKRKSLKNPVPEPPALVTKTTAGKVKPPPAKLHAKPRKIGPEPVPTKTSSGHASGSEFPDGELTENESASDREAVGDSEQDPNAGDDGHRRLTKESDEATREKSDFEYLQGVAGSKGNGSIPRVNNPDLPTPKTSLSKTTVSKAPVSKAQVLARERNVKPGRAGKSSTIQGSITKKRALKVMRTKPATPVKKAASVVSPAASLDLDNAIPLTAELYENANPKPPRNERSKEVVTPVGMASVSASHTQSSGSKSAGKLSDGVSSEPVGPKPASSNTPIESNREVDGNTNIFKNPGELKKLKSGKRGPVELVDASGNGNKSGTNKRISPTAAGRLNKTQSGEAKAATNTTKRPGKSKRRLLNTPDSGVVKTQKEGPRSEISTVEDHLSGQKAELGNTSAERSVGAVEVTQHQNPASPDEASLGENTISGGLLDMVDNTEVPNDINEVRESPRRLARTYPTLLREETSSLGAKVNGNRDLTELRAHDDPLWNEQSTRGGEPGPVSGSRNEMSAINEKSFQSGEGSRQGHDEENHLREDVERLQNSPDRALDSFNESGLRPQDHILFGQSPSKMSVGRRSELAADSEGELTARDEMNVDSGAPEHTSGHPTRAEKKAVPVRKHSPSIFEAYEGAGSLIDHAPLATTGSIDPGDGVGKASDAVGPGEENPVLPEIENSENEDLPGPSEVVGGLASHDLGEVSSGIKHHQEQNISANAAAVESVSCGASRTGQDVEARRDPGVTENVGSDTASEDAVNSRIETHAVSLANPDSIPADSLQFQTNDKTQSVTKSQRKEIRKPNASSINQSKGGNAVRDDEQDLSSSALQNQGDEQSDRTPELRKQPVSKLTKKRRRDKSDVPENRVGLSKKARGIDTPQSKKAIARVGPTTRAKAREPRSPVTDKRNIIIIDDDDLAKKRTTNDTPAIGMPDNADETNGSGSEQNFEERDAGDTTETPTPRRRLSSRGHVPWHEDSVELGISAFCQIEEDLKKFLCRQDDEVQKLLKGLQPNVPCNGNKREISGGSWQAPKSSRLEARVLAMKEVVQLRVWETFKEFASGVSRAIAEEAAPSMSLADAFAQAQPSLAPPSSRIGSFKFHQANEFLTTGIPRRSSLPNPSRYNHTPEVESNAITGNAKTAESGDNIDLLDSTDHDEREGENDGNGPVVTNTDGREKAAQDKRPLPGTKKGASRVKAAANTASNVEDDDDTFHAKHGIRPMRTVAELKEFVGNSFRRLELNCYRSASLLCLCATPHGCTKDVLLRATPIGSKRLDSLIKSLLKDDLLHEEQEGDSKVYVTAENVLRLR